MIFTDRTIIVQKGTSSINDTIVLYRGDKDVEIRFTLNEGSPFKFGSGSSPNIIEKTEAAYGQLVIKAPNDLPSIFSEMSPTNEGKIIFTITAEMINEITEVGDYTFQIRLFDESMNSRATLPEVINGIEIREPIAIEDTADTNEVGVATVGYAVTTAGTTEDAFDSQGNYNKTAWKTGDRITAAKLDKIEAGIDGVNKKVASGGTGGGVADSVDWSNVQNKPTIPTNTSQLTNDSGYITNIPDEYITETELNAKGYATTSQIPTVPTNVSELTNDSHYATETFVTNKIAEASLGGGSGGVDLSGYVTRETGNASQITFADGQTFQAKLDTGTLKGDKGDKGDTGEQGPKGDKGDPGEQGPAGQDGLTTAISVNGTTYTHTDGTITLPNYPTVPTNVSTFTNDANYASETFVTNKIAEAQLGGGSAVVIRKKPYQSNSKIALDIPSKNNDYLNQYTHPSVVNFAEGWNNYKYWMAVTPYTNINQSLENPHIVASNDMIHWKEPNPDANPLDLPANTGDTYLSDVCLVYNSNLNRLECWYRGVTESTKTETIYRKSTTDGMVWTERETLRTTTGSTAKQICPIIKYFDNKYNIWISEYRNLAFYESTDGTNWNLVRRYDLPLWHFDILLNDGKYKLFCGVDGNLGSLSLYSSDDNITFTLKNEKILETGQVGNFDDGRIYKPSCIYENGQYYLFYGGWSNKSLTHAVNGDCKIGFTRTFDGDITNLVGLDYIDATSKEKNYMKNLKIYEKAEIDNVEADNISSSTAKTITQTLTNSRGINVDLSIDDNGENIYASKDNKEKKVVLFEHGVSANRPTTYTNYGFYYDYSLRKLLIYIGGTWYDMIGNVIAAHVAVTGVAFTAESVSLDINQSSTLEYTITPSNATNKNVSFTIAPEGIASITSTGRVTGVAEGTATVTITTEDGSRTDTCTISVSSTVVEPPAESPNLYNKEGVINARYSSFPTLLEGVFCELRDGYVVTNSNGWTSNKCLGQFITVEPNTWYTIKIKVKDDSLSKSHYLVMYKDSKTKIKIYDANKTTSKANQNGETYSEVTYKLQTDSNTTQILATFGQAASEENPTTYETIYFGKEL